MARHYLDFDDRENGNGGVPDKYGESDAASKLEWIKELQENRDAGNGGNGDFDFSNLDLGINLDLGFDDPYNLPTTNMFPDISSPSTTSSPNIPSALPSLPSISNVGSVPFTGTVSNIPGGFQPLPQTAGGRKKLYQLSRFHGGINQKSSPRDIADFECQEATNVTVSSVGRIKLLGDCLNTNNSITTNAIGTADRGAAGYGLFQFTAPAAIDATVGEYVITLAPDGDRIDAFDSTGDALFIDYSVTDDHDVAHVIYVAGNGVYANDANFRTSSDNPRKAKIYVWREDFNGLQTTKGWADSDSRGGKSLIDSPKHDTAANTAGTVFLDKDDGTVAFPGSNLTSTYGATTIHIGSSGTGTWSGDYYFYVSWLFDGGVETGLTAIQASSAFTFADEILSFNFSCKSQWNGTDNHIGLDNDGTYTVGDPRIEGARIYFKKSGDTERFLLVEVSLVDGVKGALDSTFIPWTEASDVFYLASNITFDAPPEVYSYASLNGYYANEVYDKSSDTLADNTVGPVAIDVRYKTAVVGSGGIVFIGNVKFKGKHMADSMMFSMPGKPGVFPMYNRFDSPSSDGSPITALAAYKDTILQFKENGMYVINVSNPAQFYAQASFRDCGVFNPCQVFTTSFGVIFANKNGCYIYDGRSVTSLTDGKFGFVSWDLPNTAGNTSGVEGSSIGADATGVPCVGYDPRSQSIIVLKDINDDSTSTGAFVYNMVTQSWTEGSSMITNANTNRHTNFIITSGGYLSILRDDNTALENYNHDMQTDNNSTASAQSITYQTKDIDFGLPSQTKKIFKVYVTYKGDADALDIFFGVDGGTINKQFNSADCPLSDTASTLTLATLTPTTASQATGIKSFALKFTGSVGVDSADAFEINDISILYRARPIK